ncbi:MAG: hypothetical protein ABIN58_03935, partial [candidate division WOR-3 bacterium]
KVVISLAFTALAVVLGFLAALACSAWFTHLYDLPWGTFSSGRAVSADLAGASADTDINEDNVSDDRAPNFGRGAFRGPGRNQIDFSLRKRVELAERKRLEFIFQAFNLLNRPQFTGVQIDAFDATRSGGVTSRVFTLRPRGEFLQPTFGLRARDVQLGLKFTF